ncbi:methyltransferase [Flavobacterium jejuense]|uniref:Methyltransferase n=1 Tax=Flavobacterium jejuense TaxID=1544455 RepID=A0ABX0IY11_9FLAO|nr:methyltransferase [Flavobacterium jejuense]NHN27433.1 methyltransferase [Flavobacterium jejuense]
MRQFLKKITHPFLKLGLKFYYYKPRKYSYDGIKILVHPDVFPPHLTFSTKILLDFILPIDLKNKTFLELGCGSGIISLLASKKGAKVLASDINEIALEFLNKNATKNNLSVITIQSDLFDSIENLNFDYILINPPYYPKKPKNRKEQAWFCGENFEYFETLFYQLSSKVEFQNTFMILSEDCEISKIESIALKNNLYFKILKERTIFKEKNYIYSIICNK